MFKLDATGTETVLHTFAGGADGTQPSASLFRDSAGNLYGTTIGGGVTNRTCSRNSVQDRTLRAAATQDRPSDALRSRGAANLGLGSPLGTLFWLGGQSRLKAGCGHDCPPSKDISASYRVPVRVCSRAPRQALPRDRLRPPACGGFQTTKPAGPRFPGDARSLPAGHRNDGPAG